MQKTSRGGFTKLPNRLHEEPELHDFKAEHLHIVTTMLRVAQFQDGGFYRGDRRIGVPRGCFAHTLEELGREGRASSKKVVRGVVDRLLRRGWLEIHQSTAGAHGEIHEKKGTPSGTTEGTGPRVLRIVKYEAYMGVGSSEGTPEGTAAGTREGTARAQRGHGQGTIKEGEYLEDRQDSQDVDVGSAHSAAPSGPSFRPEDVLRLARERLGALVPSPSEIADFRDYYGTASPEHILAKLGRVGLNEDEAAECLTGKLRRMAAWSRARFVPMPSSLGEEAEEMWRDVAEALAARTSAEEILAQSDRFVEATREDCASVGIAA